jgi:dimethyladenosine transferase 1
MLPLRQVLSQHNILANKALSQNFIFNTIVCDKIASLCPKSDLIIEIGSGPGSLTRSLLKQQPSSFVLGIEKDHRFIPILKQLSDAYPRFEVVHEDALMLFEQNHVLLHDQRGKHIHIAGNLPFGIASQMLIQWLEGLHSKNGIFEHNYVDFTLMFQMEVAQKLVAPVNTRQRSRLTVYVESLFKSSLVYKVNRACFHPKPKVDAAVVQLKPHKVSLLQDLAWNDFQSLVNLAFLHRRKMIRNNLKNFEKVDEMLSLSGINPSLRPEDIETEKYIHLAKIAKSMGYL